MGSKHYRTTEAARALMPHVIKVLSDVMMNSEEGGVARVQAARELAKMAKLDQIPEAIDLEVQIEATEINPKVIQFNAAETERDAASN